MKKRSREINVFSMSALDLFASAMGAFILVMIILFPYYLNTSKVQLPNIDVVFVLDVTGSMKSEVDSLKKDINGIVEVLDALTQDNLGVGVILYGDRKFDMPVTVSPLANMSDERERERQFNFINSIDLNAGIGGGGNPEFEEAVLLALDAALRTNWRDGSKQRVIVFITDAPGYPEEETSIWSKARNAGNQGIVLSAVMARNNEQTRKFLIKLVEENGGKGKFISSNENRFISSILVSILKAAK